MPFLHTHLRRLPAGLGLHRRRSALPEAEGRHLALLGQRGLADCAEGPWPAHAIELELLQAQQQLILLLLLLLQTKHSLLLQGDMSFR